VFVQVGVVERIRELPQVALHIDEVERHAARIQSVRAERDFDDVAVAVQQLALPLVIAQEMRAVVMGLHTHDVHVTLARG
jgi:hypothetical protein